jgi:hypothetical protein
MYSYIDINNFYDLNSSYEKIEYLTVILTRNSRFLRTHSRMKCKMSSKRFFTRNLEKALHIRAIAPNIVF